MSILTIILIIIGSIVGGFVIAFLFFFMITYFIDWRTKRKINKMDKNKDMLKPIENERGEIEDERTQHELSDDYREFEKLRTIARTKGDVKRNPNPSSNRGNEGRSQVSFKPYFSNQQSERKVKGDSNEFRIY